MTPFGRVCRHRNVHAQWPFCAQCKDLHVDDRCALLPLFENVRPLNAFDVKPPMQASCASVQTITQRAGSRLGVLEQS